MSREKRKAKRAENADVIMKQLMDEVEQSGAHEWKNLYGKKRPSNGDTEDANTACFSVDREILKAAIQAAGFNVSSGDTETMPDWPPKGE